MKTNDPKPTATMIADKTNENNPRLSEDALYLIALALLLKQETGAASVKHYLERGNNCSYPKKMVA